LVGQGGHRGVEPLESVGSPGHRPGREFRLGSCQRVLFDERGPRTAEVRAPSQTFGPQKPHRAAETGNLMEPDMPAAVADRNDTAVRVASHILTGFNM
jgi:hypothetical protein